METTLKLPEGWTERMAMWGNGSLLYNEQNGYEITINWTRRAYISGNNVLGFHGMKRTKEYTGKGWRDRLVADAIAEASNDKPF